MDREQELELWIRPETVGYGYTVEWTTIDTEEVLPRWRPNRDKVQTHTETVEDQHISSRQLLSRLRSLLQERMPTFDVNREELNIFEIEGVYLFKHYFDDDDLFGELRQYYNEDEYRFEVPEEAWDEVQTVLEEQFYDPVLRDVEPFCVVYPKYREHPDVLFKASVIQRSTAEKHFFLMKDRLSVEQAVNNGATRLADAEDNHPF